jgi:flagellin-like hook-associated protein FlgL
MFFPFFAALVLSCVVGCAAQAPARTTDEQAAMARAFVVCANPGDDQTITVRVQVPEAEKGRCVVIAKGKEDSESKVWIGVRLTPVPAPLAAHIGDQGVMIANVVKDSPADKAGLQQYDVVVGFGGQAIKEPEDLTEAVSKAKAGQAVKLTIIRKGAKQELEITPVERSGKISMDMKYPEPEDSFVDDAVKMYGRALMFGPNGQMMLRDLGSLKHLPDELQDLGKSLGNLGGGLENLDRNLDLRILRDWKEKENEEADEEQGARVEVRVQVEKDGQTTTIVREPDGKISVTRKAADGKETKATYDDADALEKADPEAYKMYERHDGESHSVWSQVRPHGDLAREYQKQFQIDVEKKLMDTVEAQAKAQAHAAKAFQEAQKKLEEAAAKVRAQQGEVSGAGPEAVLVRVEANGAIRVIVKRDGESAAYRFKNKEDFKASEPDLYAQVEGLLE